MSSDKVIFRSSKKLGTINLRKSITIEQNFLNRPSSQQLKYDMNDLKMIMMLGLIKSYSNKYNSQINKLQQIDRKKHEQKFKQYKLNENSFYRTIEPPNNEIENLITTKNQFQNLEICVKKCFKQKRYAEFNKFMMQAKKAFINCSSSSLIKSQKNFEFSDIPINSINMKQSSILKDSTKQGEIKNKVKFTKPSVHFNSRSVHLDNSLNSNVNSCMLSPGKHKNRYKAKKKEQVYIFSRLNRTIESFTQMNELTMVNQTFKVLLSTLQNTKYSTIQRKQDILDRKGENKDRIISYFQQVNPLLKQIQRFTAKVIKFKQNYLSEKYRSFEVIRNSMQSDNQGSYFQTLIDQTSISISALIDAIRIMLNLPDLQIIVSKKSKTLSQILPKVMEARYILNYILKEIDNMELPYLNQRKIIKKGLKIGQAIDKRSHQILWRQAYIKKFWPRFAFFR